MAARMGRAVPIAWLELELEGVVLTWKLAGRRLESITRLEGRIDEISTVSV
jgi:hypothetical protein